MNTWKKALGVLASILTLTLLFAGVPAGGAAPQGYVQTGDYIPYVLIGAVVVACIVIILLLVFKKKPKGDDGQDGPQDPQ